MIRLVIIFIALSLSSSLELRNLGKPIGTAGVAYLVNPLSGAAALATSMAYDEIIPDSPKVADIETKEQAVAFVAQAWGTNILYAFIAFLLVTNILVPWFAKRRGYNQGKDKYKYRDYK